MFAPITFRSSSEAQPPGQLAISAVFDVLTIKKDALHGIKKIFYFFTLAFTPHPNTPHAPDHFSFILFSNLLALGKVGAGSQSLPAEAIELQSSELGPY